MVCSMLVGPPASSQRSYSEALHAAFYVGRLIFSHVWDPLRTAISFCDIVVLVPCLAICVALVWDLANVTVELTCLGNCYVQHFRWTLGFLPCMGRPANGNFVLRNCRSYSLSCNLCSNFVVGPCMRYS